MLGLRPFVLLIYKQHYLSKKKKKNYVACSQSALLYIKSRGKMRYLNGGVQELELDDLAYHKWEAKNSTILSWLLHSMQPDIS